MLLNLEEILKPAKEYNFAVGAFNVTESTMFQAIVEKAEELKAPVIIQKFFVCSRNFQIILSKDILVIEHGCICDL